MRAAAEKLLAKVGEIGVSGFLKALTADARGTVPTPSWLADAQNVRKSHLYTFAMIFMEQRLETTLAKAAGVTFDAARRPVRGGGAALAKLAAELPAQFNACYVVMLAWLARMSQTRLWDADQNRRLAIEMVATWPLMSLAIRPFLELASFFPIDHRQLFRLDSKGLPMLPVFAQELVQVYNSPERSEAINRHMDWLVVRVLKGAAQWAGEQIWAVEAAGLPRHDEQMIVTRLRALSRLDEFERQFPYRVAGGYSDRSPSLTYRNEHPGSARFEEDPTTCAPLFAGSLVLRLRFRGWGLVQLSTDPDPPSDESGCSGTLMLHAADGDRRFDRALVFQDFEPALNIRRAIARSAPPLGVNVLEAALMAPDLAKGAVAGYKPLQILSSTGAVQTSGVQQDLVVEGLHEVARLDTSTILGEGRPFRLFLESKDGVRPFLNGDNHLIWQDGEPVNPFILGLYVSPADADAPAQLLFSREVFNKDLSIRDMEPYQRLLTCRGPVGFDSVMNTPQWARTGDVRAAIEQPGFPMSFLRNRSNVLTTQLQAALEPGQWDQQSVDAATSLAERLLLTAQPRGTTVGWLTVLLHYGHTVSGAMKTASGDNPILAALGGATALQLTVTPPGNDRRAPNSRWLAGYTKGLMDVDAVSDFVYGDLYIPLTAEGGDVRFCRTWTFPAGMKDAVASVACDFAEPFWAQFDVRGVTRTVQVSGLDPNNPTSPCTLTETLGTSDPASYSYQLTGFPGMVRYDGTFAVRSSGEQASLTWECRFRAGAPEVMVRCYALLAGTADQMSAQLAARFSLRTTASGS